MVDSYVTWGTQAVAWVQSFRNPVLDIFFALGSILGDIPLLISIIAGTFWCVNKRLGLSLALVLMLSGYINSHLKEFGAVPRPTGPEVVPMGEYTGYALPSGHAQTSTSFWGYWGVWLHRRWAWGLVTILAGLVALSRVYLAAHYPGDVVGGVLIGVLVLGLYLRGRAWLASRLELWPLGGKIALAVGAGLLLALAAPGEQALAASGFLIGILVGWVLEERYVDMQVSGSWWQYGGRLLLGAGGIAMIVVLEPVVGATPGIRFLASLALGGWVTLGAPALFRVARLTRRQERSGVPSPVAPSPSTE